MKDRNWTNLVSSLRHRQCVLVLGPEIPAKLASDAKSSDEATGDLSYTEGLTRRLASELENDNHPVKGSTLATIAQQYEDTQGFGPNTIRRSGPPITVGHVGGKVDHKGLSQRSGQLATHMDGYVEPFQFN